MRFRSGFVPIASACLFACSTAGAIETADEIQECVRRNVEAKSSIQTVVLDAKDRVGAVNRLDARIYYKKDESGAMRVLMQIESPQDLREAAILLIERKGGQDIFMYVPELRRTRRLHGRMVTDTMFGTDFSYEDFRRMQAIGSDLSGERLADAEIQGRPVFVVASKMPESAESIYQRLVAYVDQATCVPLKVEFFQKGESPRKVLEADPAQVVEEKGRRVARKMVLRDLQADTETAITVSELQVDVEIPERLFQERTLDQRR
jgi:hypothetical protein